MVSAEKVLVGVGRSVKVAEEASRTDLVLVINSILDVIVPIRELILGIRKFDTVVTLDQVLQF